MQHETGCRSNHMMHIIITFTYFIYFIHILIYLICFDSWYKNSSEWVSVTNYLSTIILDQRHNQANARFKKIHSDKLIEKCQN